MKKIILGVLIMVVVLYSTGLLWVNAQVVTATPTPTEASLVTSPTITPTTSPTATASATPTKVTSLPKTGTVQFGAIFAFVSLGVIALGLIF